MLVCLNRADLLVPALEARRYVPSLVLAMRIARVFGRSVEEVFVLEEESPAG